MTTIMIIARHGSREIETSGPPARLSAALCRCLETRDIPLLRPFPPGQCLFCS